VKRYGVPVIYAGHQFRSRLEARFAEMLDRFQIKWEYEPYDVAVGNQVYYRPDFWLSESRTWVEVKCQLDCAKQSELDKVSRFALARNRVHEDVAVVAGFGSSILLRGDGIGEYPWINRGWWPLGNPLAGAESMKRWSLLNEAQASFIGCAVCKKWSVARCSDYGFRLWRKPCRICGGIPKPWEIGLTAPIYCVRGDVCPDLAHNLADEAGPRVESQGAVLNFWGQDGRPHDGIVELGSHEAINRISALPAASLLSADQAVILKWYEKHEPMPRRKALMSDEENREYTARRAEYESRVLDALSFEPMASRELRAA
jgi:hypothetical protein